MEAQPRGRPLELFVGILVVTVVSGIGIILLIEKKKSKGYHNSIRAFSRTADNVPL